MPPSIKNKGWMVTFGGTGINLALGILYTWSIFKGAIRQSIEAGGEGAFDWNLASLNDPYAVCCIVFAFAMILAGKCQDRFGPRITAFMGGIFVGLGFIWISQTTDYLTWILGFGLLAGVGIGFGYSAATPPALKWFPATKTGLIAGIVVAGFGLASVYIAPLSQYFLRIWNLQNSMLFFGIAFMIVVCALSMLLVNPPDGYVPNDDTKAGSIHKVNPIPVQNNSRPSDMMKKPSFYIIWFIYFIGAGSGLMVIGSVAGNGQKKHGRNGILSGGDYGHWQCVRKNNRRGTLGQDRSSVDSLNHAQLPGRSHAYCYSRSGRRKLQCNHPGPAGHLYWFQLWDQSFTFPFADKGPLGTDEFRRQLRYCFYCLGCWGVRNGQGVADADCA